MFVNNTNTAKTSPALGENESKVKLANDAGISTQALRLVVDLDCRVTRGGDESSRPTFGMPEMSRQNRPLIRNTNALLNTLTVTSNINPP